MKSRGPLPAATPGNAPVKLEIFEEDTLEEEHAPLSKRAKACPDLVEHLGAGANAFQIPPSQYNPLDEPSPLGLRLKKSPSLLDLIQMRLSQGSNGLEVVKREDRDKKVKKDNQSSAACSVPADKMKASNFAGSVLKIGEWEYKSKYEGDLVAKCYFAKRKIVWEILEAGLKSKIEIQWSDIMALKANIPDNGPGQLNVVLEKQPLFFRETNPQPRKHTLWQATSDFTDGQASTHRLHLLECPPELLKKNFEKLIQCDVRLNHLSQKGQFAVDTLFEVKPMVFGDLEQSKSFSMAENSMDSTIHSGKDSYSAQPSSMRIEDASSPSSDAQSSDLNGSSEGTSSQEQIKLPGLSKAISVSDFMNHISQCIAENMESSAFAPGDGSQGQETFEGIAQYLLSDTQFSAASDEKSLMSRVNSLCCLLQMDPSTSIESLQMSNEAGTSEEGNNGGAKETLLRDTTNSSADSQSALTEVMVPEGDSKDVSPSCKQQVGMSRKDSFSDLLLHLPRITSLPKFLFDISEEDA